MLLNYKLIRYTHSLFLSRLIPSHSFYSQRIYDIVFVAKDVAALLSIGFVGRWRSNHLDSSRLILVTLQRRCNDLKKLRNLLGDVANEVSQFDNNQKEIIEQYHS